jgi:hypothetical protein
MTEPIKFDELLNRFSLLDNETPVTDLQDYYDTKCSERFTSESASTPASVAPASAPVLAAASVPAPPAPAAPAPAPVPVPVSVPVHVLDEECVSPHLNSSPFLSDVNSDPRPPVKKNKQVKFKFLPETVPQANSNNLHNELLQTTLCVEGIKLQTLIDSGAQKNFVSEHLIETKQLPVPVQELPPHEIFYAKSFNGQRTCIDRFIECTLIHESGLIFSKVKLFVSPLSFDVILGKPWHTRFNPKIDWTKNELTFGDVTITAIRPDFIPSFEILSAKQFKRILNTAETSCFAVCMERTIKEEITVNNLLITDPSTGDIKDQLTQILTKFKDIFPDELPFSLPPFREINHSIELDPPTSKPISKPPYRMSAFEIQHLKKHISFLMERGLIRPSISPWGAPVLFVAKKNGKLRFCVDYRLLNKITVKNRFPLPQMDTLLDKLHGKTVFSSIDLHSAYHQVRIIDQDIAKTAFTTPLGLYEFVVLPFGLCNAPSTFQSIMQRLLGHLDFVVVYLDDILIFSDSENQHLEHIVKVLEILQKNKLYASKEKSEFFKKEITFLGHKILTGGRLAPNEDKVKAIRDWPIPTNVTELQSFLGFVNFYRRFIPKVALMSNPLFQLLQKGNVFQWNSECQKSFEYLKSSLMGTPVLLIPDPEKPFRIECDASDFAIGAVLSQEDQLSRKWLPVAYFSRSLDSAERNYPIQEKELLALICSLRKWRHYIFGYEVQVSTDHQSLVTFLNHKNPSGRKARWLIELSEYPVKIVYKKGTENLIADTLSRRPDFVIASITSTVISDSALLRKIKLGYEQDSFFVELVDYFTKSKPLGKPPKHSLGSIVDWYTFENGLLYFIRDGTSRLCIPRDPDILNVVVSEAHDLPIAGHRNLSRTYKHLASSFYWPKMNTFVTEYIQRCDSCQRNKIAPTPAKPFLRPLQVPTRPWESCSMDFIVALPKSNGYDAIYVVIDRLTKQGHFIPTITAVDAPGVAQLFVDNIVRLHGVPSEIISDRDPKFTSKFWKTIFSLLGTKLGLSTSSHPETDGQTERTNRSLEVMIRHFVNAQLSDWAKFLPLLEFAFNSTINSLGKTPFEMNYGFNPPDLLTQLSNTRTSVLSVEDLRNSWLILRDSISEAQTIQSKYANEHRTALPSFKVGDFVLLSTKYMDTRFRAKNAHKLQSPYMGPFEIKEKISDVSFRLKLPASFKMHDVFYSGLLKQYQGYSTPQIPPQILLPDNTPGYIVETLLRRRRKGRSHEYLVKWKDYPEYDASWEPRSNLLKDVPDLIADFDSRHPF